MDLRIQKTYKALFEAFTQLMEHTRYNDLTVGKLCDQAMIRRTTFYKHFASKDEYFVFYIGTLHDEFQARVESSTCAEGLSSYLVRMFNETTRFLSEHEGLVDNVLESPSAPLLLNQLEQFISRQVAMKMSELTDEASNELIESAGVYCGGGMLAMLKRWWLEGRDPQTLEAMTVLLGRTVSVLQ